MPTLRFYAGKLVHPSWLRESERRAGACRARACPLGPGPHGPPISVPATYGSAYEPASWRIVRRSSAAEDDLGRDEKPGSRIECTCVPRTLAPRASRGPSARRPDEPISGGGPRPAARPARAPSRRHVRLGRARVVDHLPLREVPRGQQRRAWHIAAVERELPDAIRRASARGPPRRSPRSPRQSARRSRSRRPRPRRSPRATFSLTASARREVDQDVDSVERVGGGAVHGTPSGSCSSAAPRSLPAADRLTADFSSRSGAASVRRARCAARPPVAPASRHSARFASVWRAGECARASTRRRTP